ncbi:MAG: hypothetical protein JOZ77_12310 [Candidatus Eremiobacteraeota bacterium]|nr:hypothetical protein [Candidatus Eremiobacteraeota bacterium]
MNLRSTAVPLVAILAGCAGGAQSSLGSTGLPIVTTSTERANHQAGSLDPTFGKGGKVVLASSMEPMMALEQPDGRIVIGSNGTGQAQNAVVRLMPNGSLDKSFGHNGSVSLDLYAAYAMALQPDGKLLVGGIASSNGDRDAELVRLQTNGNLDATFGKGGVVRFDYLAGTSNGTLVILVQSNGDVIAGGFALNPTSDSHRTSLARFDSSGNPDASFGANGVVAVDAVGGVTAMGLQSNGDILVCGGQFDSSNGLMARFSSNGRLEQNDRGGTLVSVAHTGSLTFQGSNEFQPDGKLLQWSTVSKGSGNEVQVLRLLRNQAPDPNYTVTPFAFDSPAANTPKDVEVAANGALLVAGIGSTASHQSVFGVARLLATGALDPSFGDSGRVVTFGGGSVATALTVQTDGKIVAAGNLLASGSPSPGLAVARYLAK